MSEEHWSACLLPKDPNETRDVYLRLRSTTDQRIDALRDQCATASPAASHSILLAQTLLERYSLFGKPQLLEESIIIFRSLLADRGSHTDSSLSDILNGLGEGLCERFALCSFQADIEEALELHERSMGLCRDNNVDISRAMAGLGWALFVRTLPGSRARIREEYHRSVRLLEDALEICRSAGTSDSRCASKLCYALIYNSGYDEATIRCLVGEASDAAPPGHADYPHSLIHMALVLSYHIDRINSLPLRRTILSVVRYAHDLSLFIDHPWKLLACSRLSYALASMQMIWGDANVSTECVSVTMTIWELCSSSNAFFFPVVTTLSYALQAVYISTGELNFLDEEITMIRHALSLGSRPYKPLVQNLTSLLVVRYKHQGHDDDLQEAFLLSNRHVRQYIPPTQFDIRYVFEAANIHFLRHLKSNNLEDLESAIELCRFCLPSLHDIDSIESELLARMTTEFLCQRYQLRKDTMDLEEALDVTKSALLRVAHGSRPYYDILLEMSGPLHMLAQQYCDDLLAELAVTASEEALTFYATRPGSFDHICCLISLAQCHASLWSISPRTHILEKAVSYFSMAVSMRNASPHSRFQHALEWLKWAITTTEPAMLSEAYQQTLSLLPQVTHFAGNLRSRILALQQAPGIARDATMHALACGNVKEALELLEQGRAVFWNQTLGGRSSVHGLPANLVNQLTKVSAALEMNTGDERGNLTRKYELATEFDSLVAKARHVPGYEYFLGTEPAERLCSAAIMGPVIILVANSTAAAAIILHSGRDPIHVPFLNVTLANLDQLATSLRAENGYRRNASLEDDARKMVVSNRKQKQDSYTDILKQLWDDFGKPIVDVLELKRTGDLSSRPRIYWCCTGHFSSLPMHAIGSYGSPSPEYMSDYAISSYIPTITALLKARQQTSAGPLTAEQGSVTLVAEPHAPGYNPLPETLEEVKRLRSLLPVSALAPVPIGQSSIPSVLDTLPATSVLHLACHGKQDPGKPLDSGFVLHDGILTVSMLVGAQTQKANFAFLSACESAMGDDKIPDEAIHLAAAMMFIGFRSVVATMWWVFSSEGR